VREASEKPRRSTMRRLSEEEIALWAEVAKSVARRRGASLPAVVDAQAPPPSPKNAATPASPPPPTPPRKTPVLPPLAPLERRLKRDLSRGRAAVDSAIDLHGMNQAQAHQALRGFLVHMQGQGAKLVIVVTGKGGKPASAVWADEPGVLRRLVPQWLREGDMRAVVLGFEEAGRAHGGAGALYVRLRRRERR
jgi:DNA-nicking Smr family endonuclease